MKNNEETLLTTIEKIRSDAEDIAGIISFGIKPMFNQEDNEDYELSAEKLDKLITELFKARDNLNKSFTSLRRKI